MQYSFTCTDGEVFTVDAQNDEEAVSKLMEATRVHLAEKHADMNMSDEQAMNMIRSAMKKTAGSEMPSTDAPEGTEGSGSTESTG